MNLFGIPPKTYRKTFINTLKKLVIVLVGVLAFVAVRLMDNAKRDYENNKTEPIVIVEQKADGPEYVIKLVRNDLQTHFDGIVSFSTQELTEFLQKLDPTEATALGAFKTTVADSIWNVRREPFANQSDFVNSLRKRIEDANKQAQSQVTLFSNRRRATIEKLHSDLATHPEEFEATLSELQGDKLSQEIAAQQPPRTNSPDARPQSEVAKSKRTEDLMRNAERIEDERRSKISKAIDDATYNAKDKLHSDFAANFLTSYVKKQRDQSPHPSTLSEMILDKNSGGHVVYQVFYMAFLGVLVFGILFPLYLFLNATLFAGSVEPLTERAKTLLSREGMSSTLGTPEIMKSIALSVAAIGVGAAVVIANNPTSKETSLEDSVTAVPERPYSKPGATPRPSPEYSPSPEASPTSSTEPPLPSPTPIINVYPNFYPTVGTAQLTQLEEKYGSADMRLRTIEGQVPLKRDKADFAGLVTDEKLKPVSQNLDDLQTRVGALNDQVVGLTNTTIPTLRRDLSNEIATNSTALSNRIDTTNSALTGFREGTQGRSLLKRASELLGRERYVAKDSSLALLKNLICGVSCSPGSREEAILINYKTLVGSSEMKKSTFLSRLGISPSAPSPWDALILRYSRVPY